MDDPLVRAAVVAFVAGVVGAALGFAVARKSLELTQAIFVWGIATVLALAYMGVAIEPGAKAPSETEPTARAVLTVLAAYGVTALIGGVVGFFVGGAIGSPTPPKE